MELTHLPPHVFDDGIMGKAELKRIKITGISMTKLALAEISWLRSDFRFFSRRA